jgi:nicotinamide mononucleotide transporter
MEKVKKFINQEWVCGYSLFDRIYLLSMLALQVIVFCIVPDSPLSIIAGISGVIATVLCAKGKFSFYFIGFIQTFSYLYLAWENKFYGEVLENLFYLVTMVWGIYVWKANLSTDDGANYVQAKAFTTKQWVLAIIGTVIATVITGYLLTQIGSAQAYTDAATNVFAIFAQLLMVRRYKEQWIWWLAIDIFCIKLWWVAGNWSMVAMYIAWTINCFYGWYNWSKLSRGEN